MSGGEKDEPDDGPVLSPDELDITAEENVTEIEDGRYVISPDASGPSEPRPIVDRDRPAATDEPDESDEPAAIDADAVNQWLIDHVEDADAQYGFHVTATFEGEVVQHELFSNDIVTSFENLLVWYARNIGRDTPVEQVLGILLMESSVPVEYPSKTISWLLAAHGLTERDSIADLLAATGGSKSFQFPPPRGSSPIE